MPRSRAYAQFGLAVPWPSPIVSPIKPGLGSGWFGAVCPDLCNELSPSRQTTRGGGVDLYIALPQARRPTTPREPNPPVRNPDTNR
jgi:hypothetical protein